ncbi:RNA polymerase sigma factor [Mycobacterium sp. SMC-18]|uniref:RNA polymerase sigma factor n=1 Tax=unclassified Mycobacterium TaxID=2642494 RepID=UPI0038769995
MQEPADIALLAEQLRNGDREAFGKLLDFYGPSMLRVARGYVSSREQAEDVVQETWIAVFKGIDRFEGRASLRTWIFSILINVAKKHGMAERRHTDTEVRVLTGGTVDPDRFRDAGDPYPGHWKEPPAPFPETPEGSLLSGELTRVATAGLRRLPERQREVVQLRDVQGFSSEEVCQLLDITAANQRVLLHRGRAVVRQELESYLGTTA